MWSLSLLSRTFTGASDSEPGTSCARHFRYITSLKLHGCPMRIGVIICGEVWPPPTKGSEVPEAREFQSSSPHQHCPLRLPTSCDPHPPTSHPAQSHPRTSLWTKLLGLFVLAPWLLSLPWWPPKQVALLQKPRGNEPAGPGAAPSMGHSRPGVTPHHATPGDTAFGGR